LNLPESQHLGKLMYRDCYRRPTSTERGDQMHGTFKLVFTALLNGPRG